ncbi:hypothetical protein SZ54_1004 [Rhizobium sp. UR51a]|nr:hypothetical protein SZ54_1004 [Rhizobium sp. UR51a]MBA8798021.1 hypothetical protein [Agrobacterium sp. RC10-4-1]MBP2614671.1 hypothetical protein [Agrobacterium pusense]MDP9773795.1 hypothetical protein [Rhizobium sp. SORGH_AS_0755]CAD7037099.1 hypothetical protein RP007_04539 [Rhizobium sp. P007]
MPQPHYERVDAEASRIDEAMLKAHGRTERGATKRNDLVD